MNSQNTLLTWYVNQIMVNKMVEKNNYKVHNQFSCQNFMREENIAKNLRYVKTRACLII